MSAPKPASLARWAQLSAWAQSTYYTTGERVIANGNIYQCTTAGTSSGAGTGPSGNGGAIADGSVVWAFQNAASTAWAPTTAYTQGQRVTNGGQLWQCEVAGTSAGSGGPVLPTPWMGSTGYSVGQRVSNNGNYYQCAIAGVSASGGGPGGTGSAIVDGSVTWSFLSTIAAGIVDNTAVWLFLQSATAIITQPPAAFADIGWIPGQRPPAEWEDWLDYTTYLWARYLRDWDQGSWSMKQLLIDGTGNQAASPPAGTALEVTSGAAQLEGAAGDTNPARVMLTPPSTRKLIDKWKVGASPDVYVRLYAEGFAGVSWTINASWDGAHWQYDPIGAGTGAALWRFQAGGEVLQSFFNGATGWTDTAFTTATASFNYAPAALNVLALAGTLQASLNLVAQTLTQSPYYIATTAQSSATPGAGQAVVPGYSYKESAVVAWARVTNNGATATLVRGLNIAGVTRTALGKVTVTLQSAPANGIVPVAFRMDDAAPGMLRAKEASMTASSVEIWSEIYQMGASTVAGTALNVAFVDQDFLVIIFGY